MSNDFHKKMWITLNKKLRGPWMKDTRDEHTEN